MKILIRLLFSVLVISFISSGCRKENDTPKKDTLSTEDSIYWYINGLMEYWYLWNDSLPKVDYLSYSTPQKLIDALKVTQDQWSFVDKEASVNSYFQEGEDFGYGFFLTWDSDENLRVLFSYPGTEAYDNGIDRSCIIQKINDTNVTNLKSFDFFFSYDPGSASFEFSDTSGALHSVTLTKKKYNMKSVLYANTYTVNNHNVGYIVFQSFLGYSEDELKDVVNTLKSSDIDELVVDLRFNTGGYVSIAELMSDILAPANKVGTTMYSLKHNKDRAPISDTAVLLHSNELNLDLKRVFFITNEYTASASELVINSLKPHMTVKTIGQTTYGKPVVMYGFLFQDWVIFPVSAQSVNAEGFGDYFKGIAPEIKINDESTYTWGDKKEACLHQALYFIENETYDLTDSNVLKSTGKSRIIKGSKKLDQNLLIWNR